MPADDDLSALRDHCTRFLHGHGPVSAAAYQRLHHLTGRPAGAPHRLVTLADLTAVAGLAATLLLELPQRDIGGQQPSLAHLADQVDWARGHGAAVHLDGARRWGPRPVRRKPAEIAEFFDTVYVSFYKGIGALSGCGVAGPQDIVAEVRDWRHRMGGTLGGLWRTARWPPIRASGAGRRRRPPSTRRRG